MNKDELEKELIKYKKLYEDEKKNGNFLLKQQKMFRKLAEDAGSELVPYKHMVLRLKEEMERTDSTLRKLTGDKK